MHGCHDHFLNSLPLHSSRFLQIFDHFWPSAVLILGPLALGRFGPRPPLVLDCSGPRPLCSSTAHVLGHCWSQPLRSVPSARAPSSPLLGPLQVEHPRIGTLGLNLPAQTTRVGPLGSDLLARTTRLGPLASDPPRLGPLGSAPLHRTPSARAHRIVLLGWAQFNSAHAQARPGSSLSDPPHFSRWHFHFSRSYLCYLKFIHCMLGVTRRCQAGVFSSSHRLASGTGRSSATPVLGRSGLQPLRSLDDMINCLLTCLLACVFACLLDCLRA